MLAGILATLNFLFNSANCRILECVDGHGGGHPERGVHRAAGGGGECGWHAPHLCGCRPRHPPPRERRHRGLCHGHRGQARSVIQYLKIKSLIKISIEHEIMIKEFMYSEHVVLSRRFIGYTKDAIVSLQRHCSLINK